MKKTRKFTIYVFETTRPDGKSSFSAQCLEKNFCAQGNSQVRALNNLFLLITQHVLIATELKFEPFSNIKKAPKKYWDSYREVQQGSQAAPASLHLPAGLKETLETAFNPQFETLLV